MVQAISDSVRLCVTGDMETILTVPGDDDGRFLLGFSDGTLLLGTFEDAMECVWEVVREGAGRVRCIDSGVVLEWHTE